MGHVLGWKIHFLIGSPLLSLSYGLVHRLPCFHYPHHVPFGEIYCPIVVSTIRFVLVQPCWRINTFVAKHHSLLLFATWHCRNPEEVLLLTLALNAFVLRNIRCSNDPNNSQWTDEMNVSSSIYPFIYSVYIHEISHRRDETRGRVEKNVTIEIFIN